MRRTTAPSWGVSQRLLKIWYQTVIEKIILYCSGVWAAHLTTKLEKRTLLSIQRLFLVQIARSYRTSSTVALQVLTGIPPIDLVAARENTLSRVLRLTQDSTLWGRTYSTAIYDKKVNYQICHPAAFNLQNSISLQPVSFSKGISIFTDGSKMSTGTGSGLCIMNGINLLREWRRRLNIENSVFQAELTALKKAISLSFAFLQKVTIYSDSQSSLLAIANPNIRHSLVSSIQQALLNLPDAIRPQLSWIPAHQGFVGNERADVLAKQAAQGTMLPEHALPLPPSHLKRSTFTQLISEWQSRWTAATTGRRTFKFLPKVSVEYLTTSAALTYFLTGHGPFKQYLFRFGA
ncbi:uncharacterized protein LOC118192121 [Stegodyphus dumicola]|uniref:uncharacterized protein LOC118192121 n=1 Tax=Stegodyphus dumicola TaxID=202533 RepID=UPI0015B0ACC0|nr:uncharacterized protein LOC118192121 [Stegodyphus dumicola]